MKLQPLSRFRRAEVEFLIQVIRAIRRPQYRPAALAAFRPDFDWDYLLGFLRTHSLRIIFLEGVNTLKIPGFPAAVLERLQQKMVVNLHHNRCLAAELHDVTDLLHAEGIDCLSFKGVVLAQQLYHSLVQREIGDIDLLVHQADAERTRDLLLARGYVVTHDLDGEPDEADTALHGDELHDQEYHYTLVNDDDMVIEVHWSLGRREFSRLRAPGLFWENREVLHVDRFVLEAPRIDVMIVYLCMHGFKHSWRRMAWIYDIAQVVHTYPETDWGAVLHQADALNGRRMLLQGLLLAHTLFAAPLPPQAESALAAEPRIIEITDQVIDQLMVYPVEQDAVDDFRLQYALRQGWKDRYYYLLAKARPNRNELHIAPMLRRAGPLLYVIRMARLLVRYIIPRLLARPLKD
ncbi:MAG: nucleotidyltransferase family protein [bacterium]|nr:nucleotidyltransferase family protein [bacterium]